MKRTNLLSIGALSKQTGVHIKSLRYYDRLGILRPAYVDPETGYRYYSLHQATLVDAIQFCVELGIPLKSFTDYYAENNHQLHYAKLIEYGSVLAQEKIRSIQERLADLSFMQTEINRCEEIAKSEVPVHCQFPAKDLWLIPCSKSVSNVEGGAIFQRQIQELNDRGFKVKYDMGRVLLCHNGVESLYFYIDVELPVAISELPSNIIHVPEGTYLCRKVNSDSIYDAAAWFPDLFAQDYDKIVMELELFTSDYDYITPLSELRCSLPRQDT